MRVLYVYRHPDMGFSIGKVFKPIEEEMRKYVEVDSVYLPVPNYKPTGLWQNIRAVRTAIKKKHYDVVHITGAEHYLLPFLGGQRTVLTVHDLGFFVNQWPSLRSAWKYLLWVKTMPLTSYITFISDKSYQEALRFVKFRNGCANVIYNAVGKEFQYTPKRLNHSYPTILHVGTKPNKNIESTAIALKDFPCKLRIIGELSKGQRTVLDLYSIDYTNISNLTNEQILQEYIDCDYVNFPSLYEGFGMPIIEGQAIGRPVLTSKISPMKDIAGDAAIIVDPTSPESIRNGYEKIKVEAENLIKKGLENAKRFALASITAQYFDIYKKVATK